MLLVHIGTCSWNPDKEHKRCIFSRTCCSKNVREAIAPAVTTLLAMADTMAEVCNSNSGGDYVSNG